MSQAQRPGMLPAVSGNWVALAVRGVAAVAGLRVGSGTPRWLLLAEGALGILAGLIAVFWPGVTAIVLLYIIAFWAIFGGLLRIVGAVLLRREIENEWTMALGGAVWVLLGIVLFVLPGAGLLSLAWLIGIFALGAGITLIALALRVRGQRSTGAGGSSRVTYTHHRTSENTS